ncbi:MAG TPA: SDR family NAD(P)-dependent oxidoreductase, partial [Acidimicrobiales bacterium]|nr:SDR family NAD(P)-dependent oxidoreductase [Acidimicrobiales bacterium]
MRARELFDLTGKTAVVTGGGSGIGRQMAEALAELGADIVVCSRKLERCQQAAGELAGLGVRTLAVRCDLRHPNDAEEVAERASAEFGRVDVLVNDAGTSWGAPAEDTPLEGWQKVIDVNLTGLFLMCQSVGRRMIAQGGGAIVNVASVAALHGSPPGMMDAVAYSASKGGVISLTRDLAWKWA